jgi:hypothetical protein
MRCAPIHYVRFDTPRAKAAGILGSTSRLAR